MKRKPSTAIQCLIAFLIVISLATSTSSQSATQSNDTTISGEKNQGPSQMNTDKINEIISMIDEAVIFECLQKVTGYGPRPTGSYGCEKTASYIHSQFTDMNITARYHNWTAWGNKNNHHLYTSQNVEGTIPGTDTKNPSTIIFNAHYDTIAKAPGANDDGSGTVAVLAAAYALSHFRYNRTLKFVAFSGEEVGLIGSQAYSKDAYERNENILLEINADMIGHDEGSKALTITATEDAGWAADIFQQVNNEYAIGLTINRGDINRQHHTLSGSDFAAFLPYGWESVCCWEGEHDPYFHTEQDTISNVNLSYLVRTTRIIAAAMAYLADVPETPPQIRITSPRVGFLYTTEMRKRPLDDFQTIVIDHIWVWAEAEPTTVPLKWTEFYYDGKLVYNDTEAPFKWQFNKFSIRNHEITVVAYDELGRNTSDWREIRFINIFKKIQ
jgi:aminopeptidase YwaD